ncbi:MAG TPA: adenylyl-sulfate kinase [Polyangia bacterium]|nr:adenylyl-sulfate kinase [Polyangia bacterium]
MQKGLTLWFTGLSGSGKSTLSVPVADALRAAGRKVEVLDGDEVRTHLSRGLGFSKADRDTNIRRIGWVAKTLSKHGLVAITAAISPYRDIREEVRGWVTAAGAGFVEVYVCCPLDVLEARDVKGLYRRARAGEIPNFTGVSDPYEEPQNPEVVVDSSRESVAEGVAKIMAKLLDLGYLNG